MSARAPWLSLRLAYELGLSAAMTLALLTVLLGGEMPEVTWLALAVPPAAALVRRRRVQMPALAGTALGLIGLFGGAAVLLQRGVEALVLGGGVSLVGILCGRLLTARNPSHDMQALLISLLLVFAGTVLHTQVTYAVVFVPYAVVVVWALMARQLVVGAGKEAARAGGTPLETTLGRRDVVTPSFLAATAGLAVALLLGTLALFVAFPRVSPGGFGLLRGNRGVLPGEVSLTGSPRAGLGGGEAVARVRGLPYAAFDRGLYLRGPVYDRLTRFGFTRREPEATLPPRLGWLAPAGEELTYEVFLQPVTGQGLVALGPVRQGRVLGGGGTGLFSRARIGRQSSQGELRVEAPLTAAVRYSVSGSIVAAYGADAVVGSAAIPNCCDPKLQPFLELPEALDPRILTLARTVAAGAAHPAVRARRIRSFLLQGYAYTLEPVNAGASDPLAAFLLEDRRGHCEYFATAFAVMLRAVGVPSRVVGGLQGGMWDGEDGIVVFTMANAHAWVEWYLPDHGWVVDDATPARDAPRLRFSGLSAVMERLRRSWDDYVVDYSLSHQVALWRDVRRALADGGSASIDAEPWRRSVAMAAGVVLLAMMLWLGWRAWSSRRSTRDRSRFFEAPPLARALCAAAERLSGLRPHPSLTMREVIALANGPPVLEEALRVYERTRFGQRAASARRVRQLVRELRSLRRPRAG